MSDWIENVEHSHDSDGRTVCVVRKRQREQDGVAITETAIAREHIAQAEFHKDDAIEEQLHNAAVERLRTKIEGCFAAHAG